MLKDNLSLSQKYGFKCFVFRLCLIMRMFKGSVPGNRNINVVVGDESLRKRLMSKVISVMYFSDISLAMNSLTANMTLSGRDIFEIKVFFIKLKGHEILAYKLH